MCIWKKLTKAEAAYYFQNSRADSLYVLLYFLDLSLTKITSKCEKKRDRQNMDLKVPI